MKKRRRGRRKRTEGGGASISDWALSCLLLASLVAAQVAAAENTANDNNGDDGPRCVFDERISTLRCRDEGDFRRIRSSIEQLAGEISVIDVAFCPVRHIDRPLISADSNAAIESLTLANCGLRSLSEDALAGLESSLEHLDLSGNGLESIPEAVLALPRLSSLDLAGNAITTLPDGSAFNHLNALLSLDLSDNLLGESNSLPPNRRSHLSLLSFNLEPLTDTLQELNLRGNGFRGLPKQLEDRKFARLRRLDLSNNPLGVLPPKAFSGMSELESLNLEHTDLRTVALESPEDNNSGGDNEDIVGALGRGRLNELRLLGNPLKCDCHARWLWRAAKMSAADDSSSAVMELPPCATPFSVKNRRLTELAEAQLCGLLPSTSAGDALASRRAQFFRVSDQDLSTFPAHTFDSLALESAHPLQSTSDDTAKISVSWRVLSSFYSTDYDWGVVHRKIGDDDDDNGNGRGFQATDVNLAAHIRRNEDWAPKNESLSTSVAGLAADSFYEVCLAVIDQSTVYYVHRSNCREVRTLSVSEKNHMVEDTEVTFVPDRSSITVTWKATDAEKSSKDVVRKISLRRFSQDNVTQLYVLEDFNSTSEGLQEPSRYYTLSGLQPETSYVVCFDSVAEGSGGMCKELKTLPEPTMTTDGGLDGNAWSFPIVEVVTAGAVASVATAVAIVATICCCCSAVGGRRRRGGGRGRGKKCCWCCSLGRKKQVRIQSDADSVISRDENDNRMKVPDGGEMVMVESSAKSDSPSVELNVDETEEDDDNDDGYSHFKSTSVISVIENKTAMSCSDDEEEKRNDYDVTSFQDRYSTATIPRTSIIRNREPRTASPPPNSEVVMTKARSMRSILTTASTAEETTGSKSKRKFWQTGCLSTTSSTAENDKNSTALVPAINSNINSSNNNNINNSGDSSLYSQYDVTVNSSVEMDAASHVCSSHKSGSHGHGHHRGHHHGHNHHHGGHHGHHGGGGGHHRCQCQCAHRHHHHQKMGSEKNAMVATRTKRNPSGPLPPEPRIIPETVEEEEGHNVGFIFDNTDPIAVHPPPRFQPPPPPYPHPPPAPQQQQLGNGHLATMGPGSYHTISHFQNLHFSKRPSSTYLQQQYYPSLPRNAAAATAEYFHYVQPQHHHPTMAYAQDYAKTLGRRRRESPMAMVPLRPTPAAVVEFKPMSLKMLKKARMVHVQGTTALDTSKQMNKMHSWNPYTSSMSEFPSATFRHQFYGKSQEELRF